MDEAVDFAKQVNKPLLVTETCWGALDDNKRAETMKVELDALKARKIGFLAHVLHHSMVADCHRPEYGPTVESGYMAFIERDGSLRKHHEMFNEY